MARSPVALRTGMTEFYFTTLVIHALYHVPQVRERLAQWQSGIDADDTGAPGKLLCGGCLLTPFRECCCVYELYFYVHGSHNHVRHHY